MQELLGSLALDEQKDGLEWQLRKLEAIEADAATKAKTYVRQGGGNTAKRLSMQAANNLGRVSMASWQSSQMPGIRSCGC